MQRFLKEGMEGARENRWRAEDKNESMAESRRVELPPPVISARKGGFRVRSCNLKALALLNLATFNVGSNLVIGMYVCVREKKRDRESWGGGYIKGVLNKRTRDDVRADGLSSSVNTCMSDVLVSVNYSL